MKFLCLSCDALMTLAGVEPDEGSAGLTFTCPGCGASVAMLANPGEMQLVRGLGVTVGGPSQAPRPAEAILANLAPGSHSCSTWSGEAEKRLERVPSFARPMAREAIERLAQEQGVSEITPAFMDEARVQMSRGW